MRANEEWRRDSERRAAAITLINKRLADLRRLHDLLVEAKEITRGWSVSQSNFDRPFHRLPARLFSADEQLPWYINFYERVLKGDGTYIGNMAAFGEGWDERNNCAITR